MSSHPCSCLHPPEVGEGAFWGHDRDGRTVSERSEDLQPRVCPKNSGFVLNQPGLSVPLRRSFKGGWLQPSLQSREAAASGHRPPCGTHRGTGAAWQAGLCAPMGTAVLPCCCQEAHVHVAILLSLSQGIWGKPQEQPHAGSILLAVTVRNSFLLGCLCRWAQIRQCGALWLQHRKALSM